MRPARGGQRLAPGRLRLNAEPLGEQVERYRRVTVVLTVLTAGLGLGMFSLFTGFGEPGIGLVVASGLALPVIAGAWLDFAALRRRAAALSRDVSEVENPDPRRGPG